MYCRTTAVQQFTHRRTASVWQYHNVTSRYCQLAPPRTATHHTPPSPRRAHPTRTPPFVTTTRRWTSSGSGRPASGPHTCRHVPGDTVHGTRAGCGWMSGQLDAGSLLASVLVGLCMVVLFAGGGGGLIRAGLDLMCPAQDTQPEPVTLHPLGDGDENFMCVLPPRRASRTTSLPCTWWTSSASVPWPPATTCGELRCTHHTLCIVACCSTRCDAGLLFVDPDHG